MKKVELNTVSEKIVNLISTMKDIEEWNMAKSGVADAYSVIVEAMADHNSKDLELMEKYTSILIILNSYQYHLDLFHEEANRE